MPTGPSSAVARADGYQFNSYLSAPFEPVALSRAVNATSFSYPLTSIPFDNPYSGAGAFTDVQVGMEVVVYDQNSSTVKGRLRVAAGGATATVLQVNEVSKTRLKLADNDKFDVLLSFRLRDKLVAASETFDKDSRIAYSTQNQNVSPLANDGGHFATIWRGVNIAVTFYGNLTLPVDFDSNGPFTHAWTVYGPDSLTVAFSSSAENPTFTFTAAGSYWVRHTATDTDVSASWIKWSVVILDANPIPVVIESLGSAVDTPQSLRFSSHANSGADRLPDGAMILLHEEESTGSYGNRVTDRSRIKGVFFLVEHRVQIEPFTESIHFEALSPLGLLSQLPGFSQALQQMTNDLPTTWQEYELGLYTNAILVYLLRWHTTYADLFDVVIPLFNLSYPDAFIQQQTPAAQMVEIAEAVEAFVRGDRSGTLIIRQNLNLMGSSTRAAADQLYAFADADFLDVELSFRHRKRVAQLLYRMFSGDAPLESLSGAAPDEAPEFNTVERKIGLLQSGNELAANERCGRHFALQNLTRFSVPTFRLTGILPGSYDWIDPAYDQWVTVSLSRAVDGRTITLTNARAWVESVEVRTEAVEDPFGTVQYDKTVHVVLIGETDGEAGVTKPPDNELYSGLPDYTDPDDIWGDASLGTSIEHPGMGLTASTIRLAVFMFRDESADAASLFVPDGTGLVFTETTLASLGLTGRYVRAVVDPWSPRYTSGNGPVNGWILSKAEVRRITDVDGTPALGTAYGLGLTGGDVVTFACIHTHIAARNFVVVSFYLTNAGTPSRDGHYIARTTDGTNWSVAKLSTNVTGDTIWVSAHQAGYVLAQDAVTVSGRILYRILKSTDYGATFSVLYSFPDPGGGAFDYRMRGHHVPYHNNADDGIFYFTRREAGSGAGTGMYQFDHGTVTDITEVTGGGARCSFYGMTGMDSAVVDRNVLRAIVLRLYLFPGGFEFGDYTQSDDAGANWSPNTVSQTDLFSMAIAGDNPDVQWRWGQNGLLQQTLNDGGAWSDVSGDLPGVGAADGDNTIDVIWGL